MEKHMHQIDLTPAQFDKLEEAADVLALGHVCVDTMAEAVEILAEEYIRIMGPLYEARWDDIPEPT